MKKILATVLCVGFLATPSFACGRYDYYRPHPAPVKHPPRIENHYYNSYHYDNHKRGHRATKTLAAIASVAGIAAIITAIAD